MLILISKRNLQFFILILIFFVFDGTSSLVLKLVLWIIKTFNFNHFHKEFRVGPI
jgi:hypothetical protein